ncbi:signal peptide peptidase SppA [Psychromonas sp. psych-6C06]|uniref:signal peptide peptidase SppA n=1 Tax=Psychromonas sp. psych-6C06 TaxID=2058089 RepID=UPI000C31EB9B|nr:signal peptide peptidase SppA [Psychromonas sp. psych-6C06]PKF63829.1 signal peptide peptidase SppA [Psychromonas sp. psych-6C06]
MKALMTLFKSFAKLINVTRLIVINGLFLAILFIFVIAITRQDEPVYIADNSVLQLNFNGNIVEQKQQLDFSSEISKQLIDENEQLSEYPIEEILQVINHAEQDPRINTILLDLSGLQSASLNHIKSIGNALNEFKLNDKKVLATSDSYTQIQYLLSSYADKIYLDPQGMVTLQGFSVYRLYFKELLDNLLITPHIFKVGTFKSFVEPFTETEMSDASKTANSHWLNQLWQDYIDTVLLQRKSTNISSDSISPSLEQMHSALLESKGDTALYAKQVGLIDELLPRFNVIKNFESTGSKWISYTQYQSTMPSLYPSETSEDLIALIYGQGEIVTGTQSGNTIGGDSFSKLLEKALNNQRVKAVVLRLDTPGGSAFASEKIRQHILALKAADKTVVVSMGSMAASGGYWISSGADHIVASPSTLTGSIGIFGMYASADKALNKIGIYNDGVGTTPLSSLDLTRPLDPQMADILQLGIEHGYQQFLSVVSEGRGMTLNEVDRVAQGRVWTGRDAKELGLVDQLGTLQDAINQAAEIAQLTDYDVQPFLKTVSAKQQLINEIMSSSVSLLPESLRANTPLGKTLSTLQQQSSLLTTLNDPKGHYAYCPMCYVNQ